MKQFHNSHWLRSAIVIQCQKSVIDLTDYSLLPNGLVFMSNTYSCFVLSRVENYFVIEHKNSKKQIRPAKHGNIIFICSWHAKISWHGNEAIGQRRIIGKVYCVPKSNIWPSHKQKALWLSFVFWQLWTKIVVPFNHLFRMCFKQSAGCL